MPVVLLLSLGQGFCHINLGINPSKIKIGGGGGGGDMEILD